MSNTKSAWLSLDAKGYDSVMTFADEYMHFISLGKTERRCVKQAEELARGFGYANINEYVENKKPLKAGDKVYFNMMDKAICLVHIGQRPMSEGLNILGAHIDSPRIDMKSHPLYEKDGICLFDTHYYGGIKKYQWVTVPLALYGVVVLKDGTHIDVAIGDHEGDEVFVITDLLVHLSADQMKSDASTVIQGENLDVLAGSIPEAGVEKDPVKANILRLLNERYGIDEEDFLSAELEFVPQGAAKSCGLDRSMVIGYGQDDRVDAYPALMAILETSDQPVDRTSVCLLVDKEEIGSVGATGMESHFFEDMIAEIMEAMGCYSGLNVRRALHNSVMLSNDVVNATDPLYADTSSPHDNNAVLGGGVALAKYVGSRGKSHTNDARAEYVAALRKLFDDAKIEWQTSELGRVDQGGGGTIAYILARYGMDVIDCGVPVLSMHSPWEITSKVDIWQALNAFKAFLLKMDRVD